MIINFLIKKNIITLVPIEETFFHGMDFVSAKKLSYESVLFNYQKLSPYLDSAISYVQKDNKLLLWFYEKSYHSLLSVPEGYLYYQYFLKNNRDAIVAIENKTIMVIQNGILHHQSSIAEFQDQDIEVLSKKYNIQTVITKPFEWFEKNSKKILNQSIISILMHFLDKKLLLEKLKEKFSLLILPVSILLILMVLFHVGLNQYLKQELATLVQEKSETKIETKEIFDKVSVNNQNITFFKKYLQQYNQDNIAIFEQLSRSIRKHSMKLQYVQFDKRFVTFRLECEIIENFLEELSTIKEIKTYKIVRQIKLKNGNQNITIEIELSKQEEISEQ